MVTINVPKKRLRPIFRWGFLISPAIKVTLFQESLLKIEPTIEAAIAPINTPPVMGCQLVGDNTPVAFEPRSCIACKPVCQFSDQKLCFASRKPKMISPKSETSLVTVKLV